MNTTNPGLRIDSTASPSTVIDANYGAQITALPRCEITAIVNAICYSSGYFDPPPVPTLASQHKDQASRLLEDMMRLSSQDPGQCADALRISADDVKLLIACLDDAWLNLNAVNLDIWIVLPLSEIRNVCARLRKLIGFEPWNISDLLDQVPVAETVRPRGRSLTVANQLVSNLPGSTLAWEPDDDWNWACIYSAHVMVGMVWLNGPLVLATPGMVQDVLKLDDQYVVIGVDDMKTSVLSASDQSVHRLFPALGYGRPGIPFNPDAFTVTDLFESTVCSASESDA